MAGGINIAFAADATSFLRGTKNVEDALDDVADSLDDLTRDSKDAGKDIDRGLSDGTKDAGDSAERLERKFRDTFDAVKNDAKDAGDKVGTSTRDGFDKAADGVDDFKDEANDSAREVAASFDGSADSIVEGFQEVAANAFGGFGPAGAVAGLAAAAGIGLATAAFTAAKEEAEKAQERVDSLKSLFDEMGDENAALEQQTRDRIKNWASDEILSAFATTISEAEEKLQGVGFAGAEVDTILRAMAGSPEDMAEAASLINEELQRQKRLVEEAGGVWIETGTPVAEVGEILRANNETIREAQRQTETQNRLLYGSKAALDAIKGGYDNIPGEKRVTIRTEADVAEAERQINRITSKQYYINVNPRLGMIAVY